MALFEQTQSLITTVVLSSLTINAYNLGGGVVGWLWIASPFGTVADESSGTQAQAQSYAPQILSSLGTLNKVTVSFS